MYLLILADNGRILSAESICIVDDIPKKGQLYDYLYKDCEFIYDPLQKIEIYDDIE